MSTPTIIEYLSEQLVQTREKHPSFRLMNNKIDDSLFPDGIITYEAEAKDSNNEIKKVKEIVAESWNKGHQNHLTIVGEGGIGKTVTLLSLPDRLAPHTVPAIYIPLHDIIGGDSIDDTIERYIKKWVLDDDEELFRQLKVLRKTQWENGPNLLLLLDGFNELSSDNLRGAVSRDIEHWASKYKGIQIITSSRYDIHNYVFTQSVFSKIELRTITKEKVLKYLNKAGEPIPVNNTVLDLITNPLFLTLYIKTESIRNDRRSSFARFRETKNAGTLIWNYLQCELWRFRNRETQDAKACVIAMEFIAPYVAWAMQQQSRFSMDESAFFKSIEKACNLLKDHIDKHNRLPQHIETTLQQSHDLPESDHFCTLLKEQLSLFVEFEIKDENTKKGNGKSDIRFKLMHQQFRDALAAMHLINSIYLSENSIPIEWGFTIDHYVMQFVVDLISEDEATRLWEQNRKTKPALEIATRNQLRLQGSLHNNDFSHLDFSDLDLSNISLYPYKINNAIIKLPTQPKKMDKTKLSRKTFSAEGHASTVRGIAITPDGKQVVSGSNDGTIRIWDIESGENIRTLEGHNRIVYAVAITPDGNQVISGSRDHTLRIWDIESGENIRILEGHERGVHTVVVTPDGSQVVSGSWDNTVRIWDIKTGENIMTLEGHKGLVNAIAVTPNGKYVVSVSDDHTIRIWNRKTGDNIRTLIGHEKPIYAVALTANGKRIVSGAYDGNICIWDIETGENIKTLKGYEKLGYVGAVTSDEKCAVGVYLDFTIHILDIETGENIRTLEGHNGMVYTVAITPDGKRVVSGASDSTVRVWDIETGENIKTIEGYKEGVSAGTMTPNWKHFIIGLNDCTIRIFDMETFKIIRIIDGHKGRVKFLSVLPDGEQVVIVSDKGTAHIWDIETGKNIMTLEGNMNWTEAVAITPDWRHEIHGYSNNVLIWDIESDESIRTLEGHNGMVYTVAITPDGKWVVSGASDSTVRVWDIETGENIWTLEGHEGEVHAVVVTPDGSQIISGSWDHTIRIWNIKTGENIKTLEGHEGPVQTVAVTFDGRQVVSGSEYNNTIRIWDKETGKNQTFQILPLSLVGLDFSKATYDTSMLKELFLQNGAKV